jgi:hypothetical protein
MIPLKKTARIAGLWYLMLARGHSICSTFLRRPLCATTRPLPQP